MWKKSRGLNTFRMLCIKSVFVNMKRENRMSHISGYWMSPYPTIGKCPSVIFGVISKYHMCIKGTSGFRILQDVGHIQRLIICIGNALYSLDYQKRVMQRYPLIWTLFAQWFRSHSHGKYRYWNNPWKNFFFLQNWCTGLLIVLY